MSLSVKVSGAYKTLTLYCKVSGVWKELALSTKVSGAWKALTTIGGGGGGTPCSIGGDLSASASTANITGPSRPVTVPSGSSGKLLFRGISGTALVSIGGSGFTEVFEEDTLTWTDMQSITARTAGLSPGNSTVFSIYDFDTDTLIQTVTLSRT
jgi:hypothetical protein